MPRRVDYYFTLLSPWAYLGHAAFLDLVRTTGATVAYRPVDLGPVFEETGGLPLARRHPVRQRYRLVELQRWRVRRGVPLNIRPKHSPFDASLANRTMLAASLERDAGALIGRALSGVWAREENLGDPSVLRAIADETGFDGAALLAAADSEAVKARYARTVADAIAADVFGSPAYVLDGEVFWGQDRIELLADALAAGRAPYRPDV